MLKGAYAHLNYTGKIILLLMLVLVFLLFSFLFGIVALVPFYGTDILAILTAPDFSNPLNINAMKVVQIINMAGGLLLPALVYIWLCEPVTDLKVLFACRPNASLALCCTVLVIIASQPIISWTNELNSYLTLPPWLSGVESWMKNAETMNAKLTEAFLSTTSTGGFAVNIFMIAILPAFAEEILFRGALAGLFRKWSRSTHLAVLLSAFIFAAIHLQFYGFLPRFLLGVLLGYLFFWSGRLWLPIIAHFTNNFLSVVAEFMYKKGYIHTDAENFGTGQSVWIVILCVVIVSIALFVIRKISVSNRSISADLSRFD